LFLSGLVSGLMLGNLWKQWLENEWLAWSVGPFLAYSMSFAITTLILEVILRFKLISKKYLITYPGSNVRQLSTKTSEKGAETLSVWNQIIQAFWVVSGPAAILNKLVGKPLFSYIDGHPSLVKAYGELPSVTNVFITIIIMEVVGDFFLYWGHRIQHEIPFLWERFHKFHHSLKTPTPVGTLYIDNVDASLQGSLPVLLTWLIVRPHLFCFYLYIFLRIGENVVNHSGINHPLLNLICMKYDFLGRASIAHHDSHHKYSNHPKGAKNYAENFYFWDVLFGTYRRT